MTDTTDQARTVRRARHAAILNEVATEEAEAIARRIATETLTAAH